MRLSDAERQGIIEACLKVAAGKSFSLFLFGSRVNDQAKGGDIDLLLCVQPHDLKSFLMQKHIFLREIKSNIGDQKIDLIITSEERMADDVFLSQIAASRILLVTTQ